MSGQEMVKKHIAVLAFPFASHPDPLLRLIRSLSAAAPDATFFFFSTADSNSKIFPTDDKCKAIKRCIVADGLPKNYVFSGNPTEPVDLFLKATPGNFKSAMEAEVKETGRRFSCMITDAFLWFAADMAQELQVPWVALWAAGPRSLLMHLDTDLIREKVGLDGLEGKTLDFLPGISGIRAIDVPGEIMAKDLNAGFPAMLHKMGLILPRATAVAINSFEELDATATNVLKSRSKKYVNIGPLVLTSSDQMICDPQGCLEWLDKQKQDSVVYISFGTVMVPPPHELAALAEALESYQIPFIWSFRGNPEEKLPKGFVERTKEKGKVVCWAPQLRILQHSATGVFITHCGWNSVLESVVGGVPMICRPFFGDQQLNLRIVETLWGIGTGIEGGNITKDGTTKALELVLSSEDGKNMRLKLDDLKKLAFSAVQSHGSSTANFQALIEVVTQL